MADIQLDFNISQSSTKAQTVIGQVSPSHAVKLTSPTAKPYAACARHTEKVHYTEHEDVTKAVQQWVMDIFYCNSIGQFPIFRMSMSRCGYVLCVNVRKIHTATCLIKQGKEFTPWSYN